MPFSNSVIEAQNRLFKYGYLFRQDYENDDELNNVFAADVTDYNDMRPHITLKGYTPLEALKGINGLEGTWKSCIFADRQARIIANRNELCEICK